MIHFSYHAPTKVVFGKDSILQCATLLKEHHVHKVLVHYGGSSALRSGLLHQVCQILQDADIPYTTLGGVKPNPRLSKVEEGIELVKKEEIDFILAVGGGSVIDSSKAIAYGCVNEGNLWDYYERKKKVTNALPVGCIATNAAAGSEMSNSSVITNENGWLKRGLSSEFGYCQFAILDPTFTYTLPAYQTMSGCTDILMHTLERYFTKEDTLELFDQFSYALMKDVIKHSKILLDDPANYSSRAEILWASEASHNGMTGDRTLGDWACHQLEHELSGMFDVAHGAGLAAIWGSWARYVLDSAPQRFAQLAIHVFGIEAGADVSDTAIQGIEAMESYLKEIGMPTCLSELNICLTEEQINELAEKCCFFHTRTIGGIQKLDYEDIRNIYLLANKTKA
ncbi:iron-containing alcohol dehydrogenase [Merdibacter massiliensis]|uniref:iron-containing alcohol dehydrogenase n=1 Tax=Merdibacter massiliensis TaxID=1871030 RepID=UPI00096A4D80|nr:iron-containing alcohol dehydrogenase [Merdibacter massiliensis]